jgi:hypothetical protein
MLVLLAIKLIPIRDYAVHGASFGAASRLWQANDRLKVRIRDLKAAHQERG